MGITQEQVTRILNLRASGLTLREIGQRMGLSHDTVGKIVRRERGATRGPDGKMIKHAGGRPPKSKLAPMIPRNDRERELADFWYDRGVQETKETQVVEKDTRKVEICYRG